MPYSRYVSFVEIRHEQGLVRDERGALRQEIDRQIEMEIDTSCLGVPIPIHSVCMHDV